MSAWGDRYRLRTLYDIVKAFEAAKLAAVLDHVRHMALMLRLKEFGDVNKEDEDLYAILYQASMRLVAVCEGIPLTGGLDAAREFEQKLKNAPDIGSLQVWQLSTSTINAVVNELKRRKFFELSPDKVSLYEALHPFGDAVARAFPSVKDDATEAAKCLALRRPTAAVFHCMRCLEILLKCMCKALKIKSNIYEYANEKTIIDRIVTELEALKKSKLAIKAGKPTRTLRSHQSKLARTSAIVAGLNQCKDAWRNGVMHGRDWYTEEQAENILVLTRSILIDAVTAGIAEPKRRARGAI